MLHSQLGWFGIRQAMRGNSLMALFNINEEERFNEKIANCIRIKLNDVINGL